MNETYKAERREIYLGDIPLDVFQLPSGSYTLSKSSVAKAIDRPESSLRQFFSSKHFKSLRDGNPDSGLFEDEKPFNPVMVEGVNWTIQPVSIEVASLFWQYWSNKGNTKAQALVLALLRHSLRELADEAFGIRYTNDQRQQQLADAIAQAEAQAQQHPPIDFDLQRLRLEVQLAQLQAENAELACRCRVAETRLVFEAQKRELRAKAQFGFFKSWNNQMHQRADSVMAAIQQILLMKSPQEVNDWMYQHGFGSNYPHWVRMESAPIKLDALPVDKAQLMLNVARAERLEKLGTVQPDPLYFLDIDFSFPYLI